MITKVQLIKFKLYKNQNIELKPEGITILAGGNNSGKSTLLHAIAVWEFCKLILKLEKGEKVLFQENNEQGLGLSIDEFLPIAIPSLKHLWTNLKTQKEGNDQDGYNLKIKCFWNQEDQGKFLEISLSLANDRLFIKATSSNLNDGDKIPTAAYLPTFAGILERENKVSLAERRKLIGKGLAGSVLRNLLLELYENNKIKRKELKGDSTKIPTSKLRIFRITDPYELLLKKIRTLFKTNLRIKEFNDLYHTSIKVECSKGDFNEKGVFKKHANYNYRDLMVEGSGFLQWLNVFTLSLNPEIDIILLDEPDAHLHPSLQLNMINDLDKISDNSKKQILIATHSSEIIKSIDPQYILDVNKTPVYLQEEKQKVGLLAGIGSDYSPVLDKIKKTKKVIFIEGNIDIELLKKVGNLINNQISDNIVPWITSTGHKERKHLFIELKKEIPELKGFSIRDRDDESINSVDEDLVDKGHSNSIDGLKLMKWKRQNIESYLIIPRIISDLSDKTEDEINTYLSEKFAIAIPSSFTEHNVPETLMKIDGKKILKEDTDSVEKTFDVSRRDIINKLMEVYVCQDLKTMVGTIVSFFNE